MTGTLFRSDYHMAAGFSPCEQYRYWLSRDWSDEGPEACFVMLNPSTADAHQDDPTIRRCVGFAKSWGCRRLRVLNLFGFRATKPSDMKAADNPVDPGNGEGDLQFKLIRSIDGTIIVAAWGVHGTYRGRDRVVMKLLSGVSVKCLGTTKDGHPRHPLYVPANQPLIDFQIGYQE